MADLNRRGWHRGCAWRNIAMIGCLRRLAPRAANGRRRLVQRIAGIAILVGIAARPDKRPPPWRWSGRRRPNATARRSRRRRRQRLSRPGSAGGASAQRTHSLGFRSWRTPSNGDHQQDGTGGSAPPRRGCRAEAAGSFARTRRQCFYSGSIPERRRRVRRVVSSGGVERLRE